jgi:hypothetical protein
MAKKNDNQVLRPMSGARQDTGKVYVDELYFRHVDQMERWRQEYDHCQLIEKALASISKLTYEEVDYTSQLLRVPWIERAIPDFSHMIENTRIAAEGEFLKPIAIHIGLLIVAMFILMIGSNIILLWISGTGVVMMLVLLGLLIQRRHNYIEREVRQKQIEIDNRIEYERKIIQEEKDKHERTEDERIKDIEQLLAGESAAIFTKLNTVLYKIGFSFHLSADISVYENVLAVKVWLPPKSIIPNQVCSLQVAGRPSFEEKEMRTINKQYFELCASILMKIMSTIYCHIPSFSTGYVYGMSKEGKNIECLVASKVDRPTLAAACNAINGLAALQITKATFSCDTSLTLLPIEVEEPEEWKEVELQSIRNLHVDLFQQ